MAHIRRTGAPSLFGMPLQMGVGPSVELAQSRADSELRLRIPSHHLHPQERAIRRDVLTTARSNRTVQSRSSTSGSPSRTSMHSGRRWYQPHRVRRRTEGADGRHCSQCDNRL